MFHILFIEQSTWFDDPDELDMNDWIAHVFDTDNDAREFVNGLTGDFTERRSPNCLVIGNHSYGMGTTEFIHDGAFETFTNVTDVNNRCSGCTEIEWHTSIIPA